MSAQAYAPGSTGSASCMAAMLAEPPTQEAYRAAVAPQMVSPPPRLLLKMGKPMMKPIASVTEQPRKMAIMRPESLASLRKSQRSSMTKIIAYSRLFFRLS